MKFSLINYSFIFEGSKSESHSWVLINSFSEESSGGLELQSVSSFNSSLENGGSIFSLYESYFTLKGKFYLLSFSFTSGNKDIESEDLVDLEFTFFDFLVIGRLVDNASVSIK